MSGGLSESGIVRALAEEAAWRITRKVIAYLQRMKDTLSGDDSELKTTWDEICAEVQYYESFYWEAYDETVRTIARGYIDQLPQHERDALWLQTDVGSDWECRDEDNRDANPVCHDDITDYLTKEYIYPEAGRWSNSRIRAYIERSGVSD